MKITKINMKEVNGKNPFYTVKWTDATIKEKSEIFSIIAKINDSRIAKHA